MLRVDVAKQLGEFSVEVAFTSAGRVTGCGTGVGVLVAGGGFPPGGQR